MTDDIAHRTTKRAAPKDGSHIVAGWWVSPPGFMAASTSGECGNWPLPLGKVHATLPYWLQTYNRYEVGTSAAHVTSIL